MLFSRRSSQHRDQTCISYTTGSFFYHLASRGTPQEYTAPILFLNSSTCHCFLVGRYKDSFKEL